MDTPRTTKKLQLEFKSATTIESNGKVRPISFQIRKSYVNRWTHGNVLKFDLCNRVQHSLCKQCYFIGKQFKDSQC